MREQRVGSRPPILVELDYALGTAMTMGLSGIEIALREDRYAELCHYRKRPEISAYRAFNVIQIPVGNHRGCDRVSGWRQTELISIDLPAYEPE